MTLVVDLVDQITMNNAARMVLRIPKRAHITPHLVSLHWLPITSRIDYKLASLCYQCKTGIAPEYLKDLIPEKKPPKYKPPRWPCG